MALGSLPPELIAGVADFMSPISCFHFAITCKAHWKLCHLVVERHKQLAAENRKIDASDPAWPRNSSILWEKLNQILDDPFLGEYVRDINLSANRLIYFDGNAAHDFQLTAQSARPPQEDIDRYIKAAKEKIVTGLDTLVTLSHGDDAQATPLLESWLARGSSEPIIWLLVLHIPFLRTFRFTDLEMEHVFRPMLRAVAWAYAHPQMAPKLPFQHLTIVAVAHYDTEMSCDPDWCVLFCAIPSVRSFVTTAMGGNIDAAATFAQDLPDSNVKELVFSYSRFSAEAIEDIVRQTPRLEKFSYDVADAIVCEQVSPIMHETVKALAEHVGHCLQYLALEISSYILHDNLLEDEELNPSKASFRAFQQLKTLRINWRIIWPEDDILAFDDEERPDGGFYTEDEPPPPEFDVRSLLPASLETLCLTGDFTPDDMDEISEMLNPPSNEFTPLLKKIYIENASTGRTLGGDNVEAQGVWNNPLLRHLEGHGP